MKVSLVTILLCVALTVSAAERRRAVMPPTPPAVVTVNDDFRSGALGWEADFSDYSTATAPVMDFASGIRTLPAELGQGTGFFLQSANRSDDVFMFLRKKLTPADGIRPNQLYDVSFDIAFGSNAGGTMCGGIGGAPGFSVFLKVGGAPVEPRPELTSDGYYALSVDKGVQSQSGPAASVAGTIENGSDNCSGDAPFRSLLRSHQHPVRANELGELWLLVGTDSGFEGLTRLYYQSIRARLAPRR